MLLSMSGIQNMNVLNVSTLWHGNGIRLYSNIAVVRDDHMPRLRDKERLFWNFVFGGNEKPGETSAAQAIEMSAVGAAETPSNCAAETPSNCSPNAENEQGGSSRDAKCHP